MLAIFKVSIITTIKKELNSPALKWGELAVGKNVRASTLIPLNIKSNDEEDDEELELKAEFIFSSEYPVLRYDWWQDERYYEVLSHNEAHCNSSRISEGVCPLLWNHNRDLQRGAVQSVKFLGDKASCSVLYDDDEEGRSLYKKMKAGTRRGISFMYQVYDEYKEMPTKEAIKFLEKYGLDTKKFYPVRVSENWELFEVSHVSIPADPTVGVGKEFDFLRSENNPPIIIQVKGYTELGKIMKAALNEVKSLDEKAKQSSIQEVKEEVKEEGGEEVKSEESISTPPLPEAFPVDKVREMILQAITPIQMENQELQKQLLSERTEKEQFKQQLEVKDSELKQASEASEAFKDIAKLIGKPETVNTNIITNPSRTEPHGLAREFIDLFNSKSANPHEVRHEGWACVQRDHNVLARFIREHLEDERSNGLKDWRKLPLIKELESYFKDQGFLSGRAAGPTIGTAGSIGSIYLDVLSALMRETHNPNNIWWQFSTTVYDPSSAPNKSVLIPRANYLATPTDVNDFLIATTDTYNSINYVRGTGTDSQSLEITTVPLTIAQWGLGLSTSVANRPIFIPEFHEATSLLNLMEILDRVLMQHYYSFEDLFIRKEFIKATTIYYNDADNVTTVPGNVGAGNDGTLTENFLNSVYAELYAAQWPTLPNNCYILTVPPRSLNNLKKSLKDIYSPATEEQRMAISNVLRAATGIEITQSSGYVGQYCGFEIFSGNTWGIGSPGASNPTVNNTVLGAGTVVTEDCFVFTYGAVGRGIALPMEIRASGVTPFNMGESFIWISREQTGPVDLDATILPANQQTRVAKLRVTRTSV